MDGNYQSSRRIKIELTEGQVQWLLDQPEYVAEKSRAKIHGGGFYGVLNGIVRQIEEQYNKQIRERRLPKNGK